MSLLHLQSAALSVLVLLVLTLFGQLPVSHAQPPSLQWSNVKVMTQGVYGDAVTTAYTTPPSNVSTLFVAYTVKTRSVQYVNWQFDEGNGFQGGAQLDLFGSVTTFIDPVLLSLSNNQLYCFFAFAGNSTFPKGSFGYSIYQPSSMSWTSARIVTTAPYIVSSLSCTAISDDSLVGAFCSWGINDGTLYESYGYFTSDADPVFQFVSIEPVVTSNGQGFKVQNVSACFVEQNPSPTLYMVIRDLITQSAIVLYKSAVRPSHSSWTEYTLKSCQAIDSHVAVRTRHALWTKYNPKSCLAAIDASSGFQASSFSIGGHSEGMLVTHIDGTGLVLYDVFVPQQSRWLGDYSIALNGTDIISHSVPSPVVWNHAIYIFYVNPNDGFMMAISAPI